ncbi:flavin monoamine oxidase family protein [Hymenobacter lucidus]|uniref:Tryptophan 2-monooxygenase n=1 Tax=Hymenobacter lucidus TaxID=2880930 RepID=A0ABS8ASB8_9BACT|nr:NAD(P)/FAD-dependent oxidoreductase [Hymenobacter lucidus]MCB2408898.1 FAD-dependent oxidoreductase [Hymenobacter lucidus]
MTEPEILVIGAGAAGLLAARELSRAGRHVLVLEARPRIGGRIHTFNGAGFSGPTEAGAEFLHGEVALTRELLQEIGVATHDTAGTTYEVENGLLQTAESFLAEMPLLLAKLHALPHDLPLADFLTKYFSEDEHQPLRETVTRFAEGYDAADARRASSFALRDEWSGGGAEDSPRPAGGYGPLIHHLAQQVQAAGGVVQLSTIVQQIRWRRGRVELRCDQNRRYSAAQVLLTVPLGVLQAEAGTPGHLAFEPELPAPRAAAAALGFGPVIKILLEFRTSFWQYTGPEIRNAAPELGFLFSDAAVPTWWSQLPEERPLLTGWVAGPAADALRNATDEEVFTQSLAALAYLFGATAEFLHSQLVTWRVVNWGADPFARGAYAYATVDSAAARRELARPLDDTLFFAGEGLYEGPAMGTVEAALVSGQQAARQLLAASRTL